MSVTRADREASLKKRYAGRVAAAPKRRGMGRGPGAPRGGGRPKSTGAALKRLLSYLEADRLRMGIAFFCVIVNTVATLTGSYMLRPIINRFIAPPDGSPGNVAGLFKGLTMMACVYLLGVIANYLQSRLMLEVAQSALVRIRTDLFTKMQKLPVRFYDTNSNGDLMSRYTNDTDTLRQMISQAVPQILSSAITMVSVFISMITLSVPLTLIVIVILIIMLLVIKIVGGRSAKYFMAQQMSLGKVDGYIEEMMAGQKVVKVFNYEEENKKRFDKLNDELCENTIRANTFANILMPLLFQIGNLAYLIVAVIGATLSLTGLAPITLGVLASFLTFTRNFTNPISQVSQQISYIAMALAGAQRIFNLMDEEPEEDKGTITLVRANIAEDGTVTESDSRTGQWAWKEVQDGKASILR